MFTSSGQHVVFETCRFVNTDPATYIGRAVYANACDNILFKDVRFLYFSNAAIYALNTYWVSIDTCYFRESGNDTRTVGAVTIDGGGYVTVVGSLFMRNIYAHILFKGSTNMASISGSQFEGATYEGVGSPSQGHIYGADASTQTGFRIYGNEFIATAGGPALSFFTSGFVTFSGNTINLNCVADVFVVRSTISRPEITGNTIVAGGPHSLYLNGYAYAASICGNSIRVLTATIGIYLTGVGNLVSGNAIDGAGTAIGVHVSGGTLDTVIDGNAFIGMTNPVVDDGTNTTIGDNGGYIIENKGIATITTSTNVVFNHGLATTPTFVSASFSPIGWGNYTWTATTTQITVTVSTSGTYTVYWYAEV
jgi:hypothetical protein